VPLKTTAMADPLDRTVQINVTIELGDYFRAYLDASKTRLAVAAGIVVCFIAALTYFFVLIGEQHILLQLSPLFIALPLVAIAGQILRWHASYRKLLADLSDSEKNILYIFHERGDGFDMVEGKNSAHLSWETVRAVVERSRYFRFVLNRYQSLIISKKFLRTESDARLMREIIRSHLGARARLLND